MTRGMGVGGMEQTFDREDAQAWRDLFADLTPDEVRVITGLVTAMREIRPEGTPQGGLGKLDEDLFRAWQYADAAVHVREWCAAIDAFGTTRTVTVRAAWHIAHAISHMGES